MTEDYDKETIEHMRDLLLRGARMLDEHCPKCGTPLFLIKETNLKYCPKCRVYLATQEELKRAKINLSNAEIYDYDEYWSNRQEERREIDELRGRARKSETKTTHNEKNILHSTINEAILTLIERLIIKIQREDMEPNELLGILEKLIEIKTKLEK